MRPPQPLFDDLTERRYPSLLAYALLFTDDRGAAEATTRDALLSVLASAPRRLRSDEADARVRATIARLRASAPVQSEPAQLAADQPAPATEDHSAPQFAPPADAHAEAAAAHEHPEHPATRVVAENSDQDESGEPQPDPLTLVLGQLSPMARASVVLVHHDQLTLSQAAERLAVAPARVHAALREAAPLVAHTLGIDIDPGDQPADEDVVDVMDHRGRRA